jgi:hypothetical protein
MARTLLLALIVLCAVWALAVAVSGGFDLRASGIPFRSTSARRPGLATLVLILVYAVLYRPHAERHLIALDARLHPALDAMSRRARWIAVALAVATATVGITHGVLVAGGSDSYGYVSQADLWLQRDLIVEQPIATQVPWPFGDWTFAPLGYIPATTPGAIVPVYSPGLPALMAAGKAIAGACGPFLITPLLGGLTVWLTFLLGVRLWSTIVGLVAAALMVTSPTFLFMLMNPMSDVPVTAFFILAAVLALSPLRGRAFWTGAAVSMAIFIRPNLVPLGAVFLWYVMGPAATSEAAEGAARPISWRMRWAQFVWFGLGGLPLVLVVAALNAYMYGAPWKSGYGSLSELYSWRYVLPNIRQYSQWLLETETPFIVALAVPIVLWRRIDRARRPLLFAVIFAAAVWFCYLVWAPFDVWWYLRFLLPSFPVLMVLTGIGFVLAFNWLRRFRHAPALALVALVSVFAWRVTLVRDRPIFGLWQQGSVYYSAAEYVRQSLPDNAIILTIQHSGSIRYYTNRLTMRWDWLAPEWWPRALDVLVEHGYRPFLLVSPFEEKQLRERFGMSAAEDGPGTVVATLEVPESLRLYDPLRQWTKRTETMPTVVSCPCGPWQSIK